MKGALRPFVWVALSCALLVAGFAALVIGRALLVQWAGGGLALTDRMMTAIYFRVVLFKGLLPQLLLTLALWPLVRRVLPVEPGRARIALGLALAALLAYAVVAPLLLSAELPGWPALQLRKPSHHIGTAVLCVAAVVGAALAGRRLAFGHARIAQST